MVAAGYARYESPQRPQIDPTDVLSEQIPTLAGLDEPPSAIAANRHDVGEDRREMIRSIYDADLGFRKAAQQASEDYVARLDSERFTRWQAVRIEPDKFLDGSYLDEGSVPGSFTISPFPDETFVIAETKYTIRDAAESVSWAGEIVGTDAGRIEISIVGGKQPGFVIRIFNGPQIIAILPTQMPGVYVSLEGNPNGL